MSILLISLFGVASGTIFSILVGFLGSSRRIGFGWAFIASLLLTPLVGLIITLLSDPLPYHEERRWGCLASLFAILGFILLIPIIMVLLGSLMLI